MPNQRAPVSFGAAFGERVNYLRQQPPGAREGLHVSDLVGSRGVSCDRFVQFAYEELSPQNTAMRLFHLKRLLLGDAFHEFVYRHAEEAYREHLEGRGGELLDWSSETTIEDPETGMVATPDIVAYYRYLEEPHKLYTHVIDIKSVNPATWLRWQGKRGLLIPSEYMRQLRIYTALLKADYASFAIVVTDKPYTVLDHFIETKTAEKLLDKTRLRIHKLVEQRRDDLWGARTNSRSHCTDCCYRDACGRIPEVSS